MKGLETALNSDITARNDDFDVRPQSRWSSEMQAILQSRVHARLSSY